MNTNTNENITMSTETKVMNTTENTEVTMADTTSKPTMTASDKPKMRTRKPIEFAVYPATPKQITSINVKYMNDFCMDAPDRAVWMIQTMDSIPASTYRFAKIRKAFVDKYFPELNEKKPSSHVSALDMMYKALKDAQ